MKLMPADGFVTTTPGFAQGVRTYLRQIAAQAEPITYSELVAALELTPPNTIHQVTEALEYLMEEDAGDGQPFIAAFWPAASEPAGKDIV